MPPKDKDDDKKTVATHRKARLYYEILEVIEAGLQLRGPEVKALRKGQCSLDGCFGRPDAGALWLENFYIPPYSFATNIEPLDPRRWPLISRSQRGFRIRGLWRAERLWVGQLTRPIERRSVAPCRFHDRRSYRR